MDRNQIIIHPKIHPTALTLQYTIRTQVTKISLVELGRYALDAIVTQNQISQTGEVSNLRWDEGDEVPSQIQQL